MSVRTAKLNDIPTIKQHDYHISAEELENSIRLGRVYVAKEQSELTGWLRYNLFWDNTPFMNLLYVLDSHRGKGVGTSLVEYWETCMKCAGYETIMTSTQSNEYAQHFYNRLGYAAVGGFLLSGDPYELILAKKL